VNRRSCLRPALPPRVLEPAAISRPNLRSKAAIILPSRCSLTITTKEFPGYEYGIITRRECQKTSM